VRGYDTSSISRDNIPQGEAVRELFSKKQTLLAELKNYMEDPAGTGIPVCYPFIFY
jgi:hypothetical protein